MGRQQTCIIDLEELNPSENEAFKEVVKNARREENARDSFIYYFSFKDNSSIKEVNLEETLIQENMQPFIDMVNSKLK